ncbi:MAG TPA: alkaline phosphatase family protein [Thermoanaerobaculia bacterium]|nr:alkaline phosphatase family protein [Thermoanaerobaculia bacterium]
MIRRAAVALLLVACVSGSPRVPACRVVLISFDGFGADEFAKQRDLPSFAKLEREGFYVERVTPVTPSQTSSAHVAMITGTTPEVNGIVGNRFHVPGTPWTEIADGFSADIDGETLVESAHRQGKRVGSIAFPTVDARNARRTADFGLLFTDPVEKPRTMHMSRADLARVNVDAHGWFATSDGVCGTWSKVMTATTDDVTIYRGPKSCTEGYPESFLQTVTREAGFWPGPPDPSVDPETFAEQNARLGAYLAGVTALAINHERFDLLLAYEPTVDAAEHHYLGRREDIVARSFEAADRALSTIVSALHASRDAIVVTGDHGLAPIDTEVHLKALLNDVRWLPVATGGGVAHLYDVGGADVNATAAKLAATGFFERIDRKSHPNSGDLVLYAWPHVALSAEDGDVVVTLPRGAAQHGGIGSHHELQTVLFAWGAGVEQGVKRAMQQTEIAAFVSRLLGISQPNHTSAATAKNTIHDR